MTAWAKALRRYGVDLTLIVLALGAGSAALLSAGSRTTGEELRRERRLLRAFEASELTRIHLERGGHRVVLERKAPDAADDAAAGLLDQWWFVEPRRERASAARVRELVSALEVAAPLRRVPADGLDRRTLGLDPPSSVVALELGARSYRILLGGPAPSPAGARYVDIGGDGVGDPGLAIITAELAALLGSDAVAFRERKLLPVYPEEVVSFRVEVRGQSVALRRVGRQWRFDGVAQERLVERKLLDRALGAIERLDAEHISAVGPAPDAVQLNFRVEGRAPFLLRVGGSCPGGVVAARVSPDPIAGCVDAGLARELEISAETLTLRRAVSAVADEVEELVVTAGPQRLELARSGEGFRLRAPRNTELDKSVADRRLTALVDARGTLVEADNLASVGLAMPAGRVELRTLGAQGAVVDEVLDVGTPDREGRRHVRRRTDGAVLAFDAETARAFLPDASVLEPLDVWQFEAKALRRLTATGSVSQELRQFAGGKTELVSPPLAADGQLAGELIDALAQLRAERWVGLAENDREYGLDAPRLRLELELEGAAPPKRELVIGTRVRGGAYARVSTRPGVFVIANRTLETLERLVVDRSLLSLDLSTLDRIELSTSRSRVVLQRLGESFEQQSGPPLGPDALARITEALDALRPEAALDVGAPKPEYALARPALEIIAQGRGRTERLSFSPAEAREGELVHFARTDRAAVTFVVARARIKDLEESL
jgi:hypothetical protein